MMVNPFWMSEEHKDRVKKAMEAYHQKQLQTTTQKTQRTNKKPEEATRKEIYIWLKKSGFLPVIVESKAAYSSQLEGFARSITAVGTSDLLVLCPGGYFGAVEVKAPARRATLKPHQKEFLLRVISLSGFAACSDSVEHVSALFRAWITSGRSPDLLVKDLPVLKSTDKDLEFDAD